MVLLTISGISDLTRFRAGIIPVLGDSGGVPIAKASFQDYLLAPSPPDNLFPLILKNKRQITHSSWYLFY